MNYIIFILVISISYCATTVKIPVVKEAPPGFWEFMQGGKDIGIHVYKKNDSTIDNYDNIQKTIHGAILNELQRKRYFRIVDVSARSVRLNEIAFAQKIGLTKDISKELSIDGLLFIEIPGPPSWECKSSIVVRSSQTCAARNDQGKCTRYKTVSYNEYVKELIYVVYAKAKLVNLETAQSKEYTNSEPAKITKSSSNLTYSNCPSEQEGFNKALEVASASIGKNLSPEMEDYEVPIYENSAGISDNPKKKEVKSLLSSGIKWLQTDSPNLELAKKDWEKALLVSGNSSASALWNLAIYYWSKGEVEKADEFFNKSNDRGGEDWIDSKKRNIISKFHLEKDRIQLENKND